MNQLIVNIKTTGISGSTLKLIAITTMLIDHIGASLIEHSSNLYFLYYPMRLAGRIAFPIFCFLLVEGFLHTSNRTRYTLRLLIFALISEIPFDLAFYQTPLEFGHQNVFFTLFLGLLAMWLLEILSKKALSTLLNYLLTILIFVGFATCAAFFRTDYSYMGVLAIIVMYLLRQKKVLAMAAGVLCLITMNLIELPAIVGILFVALYNNKRGLSMKYAFYLFYPGHLLILFLIGKLSGLY